MRGQKHRKDRSAGLTLLLLLLVIAQQLLAQSGSLDPSFNPGTGADNSIFAMTLQDDGKILIAGSFSTYNGIPRDSFARLNSDGTLDMGFDPGPRVNEIPRALVIDRERRILLGGYNPIVRYFSNGERDTNFLSGVQGLGDWIGMDAQDRIITTGISPTTSPRKRIARLFPNGSLDLSFDAGHAYFTDPGIFTAALRPNGNIVVGGGFYYINDQYRASIAELNSFGTLLTNSFLFGLDDEVDALVLQPDGKVIAGGFFSGAVDRFTAAGNYDPDFTPNVFGNSRDTYVDTVALQSDARIVVGGRFDWIGGTSRNSIARLLPNGANDDSFDPGSGPDRGIRAIAIQPDGRILVAGGFTTFNGVPCGRIVRLLGDAPVLNTERGHGSQIINSWPAAYTNWVLQGTKQMKFNDWETITNTPIVVNGINFVTNSLGATGKFYRLVKP